MPSIHSDEATERTLDRDGALRLAVSQFSVTSDPLENAARMTRMLSRASDAGADLVLFPECALSGYPGIHFEDWEDYNLDALDEAEALMRDACKQTGIGAVFGTSDFASGSKPANALRALGPDGRTIACYAKRACNDRDLRHFQPGRESVVFDYLGIRIGLAVCLDMRFPALFTDYQARRCDLVLCACYGAGLDGLPRKQPHHLVTHPTLQGHAGNTVMWVAAANAADPRQAYPSLIVDPDGRIVAKARRDRAGLITAEVATAGERPEFWRLVRDFRRSVLDGSRYGGPPLDLRA